MKNMFAVLAATAAVGLASSSYAADETAQDKAKMEYKKNGGYVATRSSEHSTDDTTRSSDSKVDVDVDSNGNVEKTIKSESTTDPKGMMNKKKDTSKTEIEEKANGGYKQTTVRKHTDANGTDTYYKTVTDVEVDNDGNVTSTATSEKTNDPKGWWNETKTTSKTKTVNGRVVEHTEKSK